MIDALLTLFEDPFVRQRQKDLVDSLQKRAVNESNEALFGQSLETALIVGKEIGLRELSLTAALVYPFCTSDEENIFALVPENDREALIELVHGLQKIEAVTKKKIMQADNFIHLLLTLSQDPRAILIMLAAQLNKMRQENITPGLLDEIRYLYVPIAHRLGLYMLKSELEERWLKLTHYDEYRSIADQLTAKKYERQEFIAQFIAPLDKKMRHAEISCEIKGRPKSIYSIWSKMNVQKVRIDEVYDKFAIRIIISDVEREREKELCWRAYSLVTEEYRPFPKRLRDWISHPKSSGYESLHTTVETEGHQWIEVQIRTQRMDDIAEKGDAAHWKYKESQTGTDTVTWLAAMRTALENRGTVLREVEDLKHSLYAGEMYVFTPEEDLKKLRAGSTVLDFAFSVHTHVGFHCTGAIVNGKRVSIRHELFNGDVVKVSTAKKQKPTYEWLSIVKSTRVKNKIRRILREQELQFSEIGREILRRKLLALRQSMTADVIKRVADFYGCEDAMTLYEKIGNLSIGLLQLKKSFVEETTSCVPLAKSDAHASRSDCQTNRSDDCLIIDGTLTNVTYSLAKCCTPVFGDEIFGFVTVNRGLKIHKKTCRNTHEMFTNQSYRFIKAEWAFLNNR